jgi:small subunit ribosomal protein S21
MSSSKHENITVKIAEGMPVEKAIKKFKRLCDSYGIVKQYRAKESYKKPSIAAKEKREAAEKRRKKTESKFRRGSKKI